MKFTKMQGCGNDYVYINGMKEKIAPEKKPALVREMSDRHFGVGSDGVIFINDALKADFEMEMWNADGTRSEMCGNGIRCVAKYVYDKGLTRAKEISIISGGQIKYLTLKTGTDQTVEEVRVDMGAPILVPEQIPVTAAEGKAQVVNEPIEVDGKTYAMTCVSMGNPHAVVFMDDVEHLDIEAIGPKFEHHPYFPKRVNTEFVQVVDESHVIMRVWERGTGETLACGTGACATAVACALNGKTGNRTEVKLLGGTLQIEWDRDKNTVLMTGPAKFVFEGEWPDADL
ncbi:MAG: diaminopimelate epimerase [Lachnospiraceae bacterium]|nr:diaminopimelate epimerase [Lachnospiraceae bacterium]